MDNGDRRIEWTESSPQNYPSHTDVARYIDQFQPKQAYPPSDTFTSNETLGAGQGNYPQFVSMREVEIRPAGFTSIGGNDYYPQYPSTSRMDAPIPSAEFMQTEENASTYYEQYYRQEENIQPTSSPQGMDTPPPDDPLAYVAKLGELSIAATKKHRDYNNSERGIAKTQRQTDNRRKKPRDDQTNRDYDVRDKDKLLNRYRSQYKPGRDSKVQASLIEAQKYELPVRELTKVGPLLKGVKLNLQALKGNAQANEARREQVINLETDPEGYQGYQGPEQYR